ncbi:MAG TPA: hypothetical protein VNT60_11435 [Deinococcales bacterium]|nr:hypothetical protein [Deinococcales bacterium]
MEVTPWILLAAVTVWAVVIAWAWELLDRRDERGHTAQRSSRSQPATLERDTNTTLANQGRFQSSRQRQTLTVSPARVTQGADAERILAARRARGAR